MWILKGTETSRQQAAAATIIEAVHDRAKVLEDVREAEAMEASEQAGPATAGDGQQSQLLHVPENAEMVSAAESARNSHQFANAASSGLVRRRGNL